MTFFFFLHFQVNRFMIVRADSGGGGENTLLKKCLETRSLNFSGEKPITPVLDTINYPNHMKNLSVQVTKQNLHCISSVWL